MLTEQQHRKLAADADRAARRKGLSQEQRELYLLKASSFRSWARRAAELASQPTDRQFVDAPLSGRRKA